MNGRAVPKDQDFSGNMPLEVFQELNHLQALDAAGMDLKPEPPQGQAADKRKAFPVERLLQNGCWAARRPGARPRRPGGGPAFVNKDDGLTLPAHLFLRPARPPVASGQPGQSLLAKSPAPLADNPPAHATPLHRSLRGRGSPNQRCQFFSLICIHIQTLHRSCRAPSFCHIPNSVHQFGKHHTRRVHAQAGEDGSERRAGGGLRLPQTG